MLLNEKILKSKHVKLGDSRKTLQQILSCKQIQEQDEVHFVNLRALVPNMAPFLPIRSAFI